MTGNAFQESEERQILRQEVAKLASTFGREYISKKIEAGEKTTELWEAIGWAQWGYHEKPVGLPNGGGFYDLLVPFYRHMADVGFVRPAHSGIMIVENELNALLDAMASYTPHQTIFAMKAEQL